MGHRQIRVARTEHALEPIDLVYGDRTFTIPGAVPLDGMEAMEDGNKIVAFLKAVLGAKQWRQFVTIFDTQDMEALADAVAEAYGSGPGESVASGDSSPTTSEP